MKNIALCVLATFVALFVACGDKEKKEESTPVAEPEKVALPECDSQEVKSLLSNVLAEEVSKNFSALESEAAEGVDIAAAKAKVEEEAKVETLNNFSTTMTLEREITCKADNQLGVFVYSVALDDANALKIEVVSANFQEKIKELLTTKE